MNALVNVKSSLVLHFALRRHNHAALPEWPRPTFAILRATVICGDGKDGVT